MTDDSRPPFILPDSVLMRRRGLLEGAMPQPLPRQWAEHLELLTADGKLTGVDDMLALMQRELDRLQEQIDPDDEPDRHSETVLAAATAGILSAQAEQAQRESRREVYFSLLLGYLYGRLTKPGQRSEREAAVSSLVAEELSRTEGQRQVGLRSVEDEREAGRQWMREKAKEIWRKDRNREMRISEVASVVREGVLKEAEKRQAQGDDGPRKYWAKSPGKIREAISKVAPDYAAKPGRPPRK